MKSDQQIAAERATWERTHKRDQPRRPHRMLQMPPERKARMRVHCAYTALLRVPHDTPTRDNIQPALACLRDELARLMGKDPQLIQDAYETETLA